MNLIKPKKLKKGDTVVIIAPAGEVEEDKIYRAKEYLEKLEYKVKLGSNIFKTQNYLAGTDEERLEDLHNAFTDTEVDAIICARGGYGALRLVNKIDYNLVRNNPKIFCGFSDITILNAMFHKKCGLINFSGPMAQSDFYNIDDFTKDEFFKCLTSDKFEILPNRPVLYGTRQDVEGILFGGNLSTLSSLCGVDFIPDESFILFIEDLNESIYKIDRYITQLMNIDMFKSNLRAILIGDFLDLDDENIFYEYFKNIAEKKNIPIIGGYPFSHTKKKTTVPIGAYAKLRDCKITIENYLA